MNFWGRQPDRWNSVLAPGRSPGHEMDDWLRAQSDLMLLPVRKIAELDPPKTGHRSVDKSSPVNLVPAAPL